MIVGVVGVPSRKGHWQAKKQMTEWVNEKDTNQLSSTTPLLVLHREPNEGKSGAPGLRQSVKHSGRADGWRSQRWTNQRRRRDSS